MVSDMLIIAFSLIGGFIVASLLSDIDVDDDDDMGGGMMIPVRIPPLDSPNKL
jgi:hypothetical protein